MLILVQKQKINPTKNPDECILDKIKFVEGKIRPIYLFSFFFQIADVYQANKTWSIRYKDVQKKLKRTTLYTKKILQ